LGKGKEMVDKLTDLITIFEAPALNFSSNRADGDDILGDAYEYLMRNFASASGKSKGEFYTPSEVSRILSMIIGIIKGSKVRLTLYDPTSGSGSLLLKGSEQSDYTINLYGQEKSTTTAALAKMNMILHNNPEAEIAKGQSTLSDPYFKNENGDLKTFDYAACNPPFSTKNWRDGFSPENDIYRRFENGKIPPEKNGDYAFLLHIIKSLKSTGKGAVILPHGVLFRGNVEGEIRKDLINRGVIKGIIGLPPNLFYGTGIPACIIVIDMEQAELMKDKSEEERGIFMVDASKGFMKDGNKNRLRERDIHKIVDIFNNQIELPKFSRFVSYKEISDAKNDFNLNIPRYIDSQEIEDIQDIAAHLLGGIPNKDIDVLNEYWEVYPDLKQELFSANREGYSNLKIDKDSIKQTIFNHPQFVSFSKSMDELFAEWKTRNATYLSSLAIGIKPKKIIHTLSEDALATYTNKKLLDKYDVFQHIMNYWDEVLQDDCYLIALDGWKAEPYRIVVENSKTGKKTDKGWECDLVPKKLVIDRYFANEKKLIEQMETELETIATQLTELLEENSEEDGFLEGEKSSKGYIQKRLKDLKAAKPKVIRMEAPQVLAVAEETDTAYGEQAILEEYLKLLDKQTDLKPILKKAVEDLDTATMGKYKTLIEQDVKQLVVNDKWMGAIEKSIKTEMERISQRLTQRIKELAERYETTMPQQTKDVAELEDKVKGHLEKMGFSLN